MHIPSSAFVLLALFSPTHPLKIASSLSWIEHTPQPYALETFYNGTIKGTITSGSVANLFTSSSFDLAANAETQGLKQYATHKNLRLIYVICEVPYRLVAAKSSGIKTLADLKGKKIGTVPGTSAEVFVRRMLDKVGVSESEYSLVAGDVCMKAPCGSGTFPALLESAKIDAFGVWEASVELGVRALGGADKAVLFQDVHTYREVYSLYSTTEKLNNAATRSDIVGFVRALNRTLGVFRGADGGVAGGVDRGVYNYVAGRVGMDVDVVKAVWGEHVWSGVWGGDLLDLLVSEDAYLAKKDGRKGTERVDLERFLDDSVIREL